MTPSSLVFLVEEAVKSIRRNSLMSLAALSSVMVALTVFGGSILALYLLHQFVAAQPEQFQIAVFLKPATSRAEARDVQRRIQNMPGVRSVNLVTKEDALQDLMEQDRRRGTQVFAALAGANPLPDRLDVKPTSPERCRTLVQALRNAARFPEVEYVRDEGELLAKLLATARLVRRVGLTLAVLLLLATGVIIHNTLRLTVLARQREIRIMRLVGASRGFIQMPLLLEGIFYGMAGAIVAALVIVFAASQISRYASSFQTPLAIGLPPAPQPWIVFATLVAAGVMLGAVTSVISIRRFLR